MTQAVSLSDQLLKIIAANRRAIDNAEQGAIIFFTHGWRVRRVRIQQDADVQTGDPPILAIPELGVEQA